MNLPACLDLLGPDVVPLGRGEVAMPEQRRGQAGIGRERSAKLVAAQARKLCGLIVTPSSRSVTRMMRP